MLVFLCSSSGQRGRGEWGTRCGPSPEEDEDDVPLVLPSDGGALDASELDDASPCAPLRAFVLEQPPGGPICNPEGVLPGSTAPAILDYTNISQYAQLDGVNVTACLGVEFQEPVLGVSMVAMAVASGCERACSGEYCDAPAGRRAYVFAGAPGSYVRLARFALGTSPAAYWLAVPRALDARQIVVCRSGANINAEDPSVRSITGTCAR